MRRGRVRAPYLHRVPQVRSASCPPLSAVSDFGLGAGTPALHESGRRTPSGTGRFTRMAQRRGAGHRGQYAFGATAVGAGKVLEVSVDRLIELRAVDLALADVAMTVDTAPADCPPLSALAALRAAVRAHRMALAAASAGSRATAESVDG